MKFHPISRRALPAAGHTTTIHRRVPQPFAEADLMLMKLSPQVAAAVAPLLKKLPLDRAMTQLVVERDAGDEFITLAKQIVATPPLASQPLLCAGLWLYVDDLDRSHTISQGIENPTGSFWHGIMHSSA